MRPGRDNILKPFFYHLLNVLFSGDGMGGGEPNAKLPKQNPPVQH
jgi:hypothetical protein